MRWPRRRGTVHLPHHARRRGGGQRGHAV